MQKPPVPSKCCDIFKKKKEGEELDLTFSNFQDEYILESELQGEIYDYIIFAICYVESIMYDFKGDSPKSQNH